MRATKMRQIWAEDGSEVYIAADKVLMVDAEKIQPLKGAFLTSCRVVFGFVSGFEGETTVNSVGPRGIRVEGSAEDVAAYLANGKEPPNGWEDKNGKPISAPVSVIK